ncbi:hypothetical protein NP233_g4704 [Leucocoprinus birnbaumii]|uniref:Wax synthase domain-containing protein n=1 Tax=Leucocoprinus birnbaumii TaxID=56174 RepID=A0AAD5YX16_9AGAR|nr:hypothetical protein NP233_g4704 [Leucocoprinus birnbaumii]
MLSILPIAAAYFLFVIITISISPSLLGVRFACLSVLSLVIDNIPRPVQGTPTSSIEISVTYQTVLYMAIMLLVTSDHVLLHRASHAHTRIKQHLPFTHMSILSRFIWATDLVLSQRGVNWSWQIPYLRRSSISRGTFLIKKLSLLMAIIVLTQTSDRFIKENKVFQGKVSMYDIGFKQRVICAGFVWWTIASSQLFNYTLSAILLVSLGVYEPYDWPSLYGRWGNAKSVRKFWGQTWHQLLRRPLQEHGKLIPERILRLPSNSRITSYVQLYMAFFLSGLCHAVADWAVAPRQLETRTHTVAFFLLQAVVITCEDAVISVGRKLGLSKPPPVLCYFWVTIWMGWSGPLWMDGMLQAGVRFRYDDFLKAVLDLAMAVGVIPQPAGTSAN